MENITIDAAFSFIILPQTSLLDYGCTREKDLSKKCNLAAS